MEKHNHSAYCARVIVLYVGSLLSLHAQLVVKDIIWKLTMYTTQQELADHFDLKFLVNLIGWYFGRGVYHLKIWQNPYINDS